MFNNPENKYALKLNTPELRQEAFKQYCAHIAAGWQKKSWFFDHPTITCSWATIEKTILDYAEEFDLEQMVIADGRSMKHWESILYDAAKGVNKDANTAALQMIFRNKFGWDKHNGRDEDTRSTVAIQHNQQQILMQMNEMQESAKAPIIIEVQETPSDSEGTQDTHPSLS